MQRVNPMLACNLCIQHVHAMCASNVCMQCVRPTCTCNVCIQHVHATYTSNIFTSCDRFRLSSLLQTTKDVKHGCVQLVAVEHTPNLQPGRTISPIKIHSSLACAKFHVHVQKNALASITVHYSCMHEICCETCPCHACVHACINSHWQFISSHASHFSPLMHH
jgi:hypothetical protein